MEEIKRQVNRAQRRLIGQQFLQIVVWSLFATLLIAAVGLAIPKIWALSLQHDVWNYTWLGSSLAVGFVIAGVWTYRVRRSSIDAAIELDRRYGLKERVSSTLALNQEEAETAIGRALVADAIRKVERINVREQFRIQPTWRVALPVIPLAVIAALLFVPNASLGTKAVANTQPSAELKQALQGPSEKLTAITRKNDEKKAATEEELQTEKELRELARQIDGLANAKNLDKKQALIKIRDIAKDLQEKQKALAGAQEMKQEMIKLGKIAKGPADKLADSLKNGDFKEAQKQLEQLKDDLANGKLDDQAKEQLARQMNDLQEKLQQLAADQKEAREKVEQARDKKLAQGDRAGAQQLQEKLDAMNKPGKQAEQKLNELAQKMGQVADGLKQGGDPKEARQRLDQLAQAMKEAQGQLDQIKELDEVLDQLAEAKDAMNGKEGKEAKAGMEGKLDGNNSQARNKGNQNGRSGKGPGGGERPEEQVTTQEYLSKVHGQVKQGASVRTDNAGGENLKVEYQQAVKAELESTVAKDPDAFEQVNLPREQQRQVEDYFNRFRKGGSK